MKTVRRVLLGLLAVVVILAAVMVFWGGRVIEQTVNTVGPQVLGVPVTLTRARLHPLRGHVSLTGLVVGNPEGFQTASLFDLTHLEVDLDLRSLFSDTIVIHRILIERPQITYEAGLRRTNLGTLLAGLESDSSGEAPAAPEEKAAAGEGGKTVVIRELKIVDARAQVSATAMRGHVVPVQLATITLTELGGADQSLTQITTQVLKALAGAIGNAVLDAGDLLGDGLKAALGGVGALGGAALDGAGALGGAALDGAQAVAGAAGKGAQAVTGAVGGGARAVTGAVGSGLSRLPGIGGREADDDGDEQPDAESADD